ncbi:MAG TPA: hypothetical protein VNK52_14340 [Hyphomicrobiaceae bacterium]|nr:hypothetical protein [Hyphomicrobiaceae bacterium]
MIPTDRLDCYNLSSILTNHITPGEIEAMLREQEREDFERLEEFAAAIMQGGSSRLHVALNGLAGRDLWPLAAEIADFLTPSDTVRAWCLEWWVANGEDLRLDIADDAVLVALLRALLPPYTGPDRQLYRSEFAVNASVGCWGVSWSASLRVAREFAHSARRKAPGGTVVATSRVPAAAIIARVPRSLDRARREREVLVDPKRLKSVRVVKRYAEQPILSESLARAEASISDAQIRAAVRALAGG